MRERFVEILEQQVLLARSGSVSAPAGCGKTQLIARAVLKSVGTKPVLILTHTNAGKAALLSRLRRLGVQSSRVRLATLDGWALALAKRFPGTSGLSVQSLRVEQPSSDYRLIRVGALSALGNESIGSLIGKTYSRVLVDEYQDCGLDQHRIVLQLLTRLPVIVFGDPLQAIFGFSGPTVDWQRDVLPAFPRLFDLDVPWRWNNAGAPLLGTWLLQAREILMAGGSIDLRSAPSEVSWRSLQGSPAEIHQQRILAANTRYGGPKESVLLIGESKNPAGQRLIAQSTLGATAVEALDLKDLTAFGRTFDPHASQSVFSLVDFASELMTNLEPASLRKRIPILVEGRGRAHATKIEQAFIEFAQEPSLQKAAATLRATASCEHVRVYRPDVWRMCISALETAGRGSASLYEAIVQRREQSRHVGRSVTRKAVGSTLLLKGLEADTSVVLFADGLDAKNLYVAISRGSRRVVVCSSSPLLPP